MATLHAALANPEPLAEHGGDRKTDQPSENEKQKVDPQYGNPTGVNQHSGSESGTFDNVQGSSSGEEKSVERPTGTSREQALRKLRVESLRDPVVGEIYERVLGVDHKTVCNDLKRAST